MTGKPPNPALRALFAAVRDFDARFAARKRERRLLEFSDFEHLALRLLRDADGQPTELCQGIRQGYAAVMVDEYQDTNALQDALYRCLASPAGDDLFLVGDLKRSIYHFRQADPSIFRKGRTALLPAARPAPAPKTAGPARTPCWARCPNFRSAPQVVAGINFVRTAHDARSGRHGLRRRTAPGLRRTRRVRGQCGGRLPARRCRRDGRTVYRHRIVRRWWPPASRCGTAAPPARCSTRTAVSCWRREATFRPTPRP